MPRAPLLLSLAVLSWACVVGAQARDPAAAELLFREGRAAYDTGDFETACAKFAESQRLDPGAGTLINLAACYEKQGRLALAWDTWQQALRALPSYDERRPEVKRRAEALEEQLPRLKLELAADAPANATVERDGVTLGGPSLGLALPVDPGRHRIVVSAEGREPKTYEIELAPGDSKTLQVTAGPAAKVEKPTTTPPPSKPAKPSSAPPTQDKPASGSPTLGYIVGGLGVASLAASGVTGVLALDKKSEMEDDCSDSDGTRLCGPNGLDAADSGKTYATISTITFAAGVVGVGVGAFLILSADDSDSGQVVLSTQPSTRGGMLNLSGSF